MKMGFVSGMMLEETLYAQLVENSNTKHHNFKKQK